MVPAMPRQRWRNEVLDELRAMRAESGEGFAELRGELGELRSDLTAEFRQNRAAVLDVRAAIRDMKGSVDRNTDVTERSAELLSGLIAQVHADRGAIEDLRDEVRAQTDGLLALIDELRNGRGR